jgi:hypothetical protein
MKETAEMESRQQDAITKEDEKKRAYMYFHPNREFYGDESQKLKKIDDGTFTDNGYK